MRALIELLRQQILLAVTGLTNITTGLTNVTTGLTNITTHASTLATQLTGMAGKLIQLQSGVPSTAIQFAAQNATNVSDGTLQAVVAAAGASKSYYITQIMAFNLTTTEYTVTEVCDEDGNHLATLFPLDPATGLPGGGAHQLSFWPPLKVTANKGISAKSIATVAATGDVKVSVNGYVDV